MCTFREWLLLIGHGLYNSEEINNHGLPGRKQCSKLKHILCFVLSLVPFHLPFNNFCLVPRSVIISTWSKQWMIVWPPLFRSCFFSLTSSQNYRQEIESRIGARGCVCFVAKGVLWRQQVGLWIPSPTRRHEAHAQEASPAKYSWPPKPLSPPPPSTGLHRGQTVKVASLLTPLPPLHPQLSAFMSSHFYAF